jgi:hypothetical protein
MPRRDLRTQKWKKSIYSKYLRSRINDWKYEIKTSRFANKSYKRDTITRTLATAKIRWYVARVFGVIRRIKNKNDWVKVVYGRNQGKSWSSFKRESITFTKVRRYEWFVWSKSTQI